MKYFSIWQYEVVKGKEKLFEQIYGPEGDWVRMFEQGIGYCRTTLIRNRSQNSVYVTIDEWESLEKYREFHQKYKERYGEIDQLCSELTVSEVHLGEYESVA
jgi:heme-degrading monooxygenase HmoA